MYCVQSVYCNTIHLRGSFLIIKSAELLTFIFRTVHIYIHAHSAHPTGKFLFLIDNVFNVELWYANILPSSHLVWKILTYKNHRYRYTRTPDVDILMLPLHQATFSWFLFFLTLYIQMMTIVFQKYTQRYRTGHQLGLTQAWDEKFSQKPILSPLGFFISTKTWRIYACFVFTWKNRRKCKVNTYMSSFLFSDDGTTIIIRLITLFRCACVAFDHEVNRGILGEARKHTRWL